MRTPIKIALVLLWLFSLVSNAQEANFNVNLIPEALKKNTHSVVRFHQVTIDIESPDLMKMTYNVAITVLDKLAEDDGNIAVSYDKRRKIKKVTAYYYDANGNEIKKVKRKDYGDFSASGGDLFNDSRFIYYDYNPTRYPYTVHYTYEIETSNTAFIPKWSYTTSYNRSIEKSSFKISYPTNLELYTLKDNFNSFEDKVSIETSENAINILADNIVAIKHEALSPSITKIVPQINFALSQFNVEGINGQAQNWSELGKWEYDFLYKGVDNLPQTTKQEILELVKNIEDPKEKARLVYNFVQEKVRYISVQVGIGGLKPMNSSEVDELGYGDCKALSNYTKSLLNVVGVKSYFTELYGSRYQKNMHFDLPSIHGNHVILNVPFEDEEVWLECTSQNTPFGYIAGFTDDRDVIVITEEGGVLKHTKKYEPSESIQITKGSFKINRQGAINAVVNIKAKGLQYNQHLSRYESKKPSQVDKSLKSYFSNINNIELAKKELVNNKKEAVYEEYVEFSATDYVTVSNNQFFIPINAFNKSTYMPKRVRNRKLPFEILRGYKDIDEVEISIPSGLNIEFLPSKMSMKTKFGSYSAELVEIEKNKYVYKRELEILDGKYEKEEYDDYRDFRKKIRKYDNHKIILNKTLQ